jgi:hypothetical protein
MAQQLSSLVQNTLAVDVTNITGTIPVLKGGTGATTAASALTNLGAYASSNPSGYTTNTGTVTSVAALTLGTTGTDVTSTVATGTTTPVITLNLPTASATNRGALSSADWTTFNGKLGSYTETDTLATVTARGATTTVVPTFSSGATIQGLTVGLGANAVGGNTVLGASALGSAALSGAGNSAVGVTALRLNNTGANNSTIGAYSLFYNTTGANNSGVGASALYNNVGGAQNTGVGAYSLNANTSGSANIGIGYNAGNALTTGSNNTIIGSVPGTAGLANTVIIAAGTTERLRIDSSGNMAVAGQIESTLTGFKFPDGTTQATAATGGGAWTKITANTTATTKKQYVTDTTAGTFIVTLPASPAAGDYVYFMDAGNWAVNNLTVARNGSTIEASTTDLVLDVRGLMVQLIFDGTTWQVMSNIGPQGPIGPAQGVGKVIAMAMIFGG